MEKTKDYVLGEPVKKFRITYLNYKTGQRDKYMNTAFTEESEALHEMDLLKRDQKSLVKRGYKATRGYFKVKPCMVRPIIKS